MSRSTSDGAYDPSDIGFGKSSVQNPFANEIPLFWVQKPTAAVGSVGIQLWRLGKGLFNYTHPRLRSAGCLRR